MVETKIIAGKHKCKRKLDMRIVDVKDDDNSIVAWIIYGICKKCNTVLINGLFTQTEKPVQDRDFIIDYDKISSEVEENINPP